MVVRAFDHFEAIAKALSMSNVEDVGLLVSVEGEDERKRFYFSVYPLVGLGLISEEEAERVMDRWLFVDDVHELIENAKKAWGSYRRVGNEVRGGH